MSALAESGDPCSLLARRSNPPIGLNRFRAGRFLVGYALTGGCLFVGLGAQAQSVNYGVLSEIFAQPVTTSATGKPQLASEVPASLTILSAEDIRRFGARTLPDVLAQVMSVDVLTWGVGAQDVGLRGLTTVQNPRVLVLVNGRQVYLEHVGTPKWSGIPVQLSEIRQIEVVRGPQAALFGFNAVSGVVNIITYNPLLDNRNTAEVVVGTGQRREFSAVTTLRPLDKLGIRLSAGGWSLAEYSNRAALQPGIPSGDSARRATASLDALAQISPDVQTGIELTFSDWRNGEVEAGALPQYGRYETESAKLYTKADTRFGLIDGSVYFNRLDYDLESAETSFPIQSISRLAVAQLQTLKRIAPDLSVRIGGEYRYSDMDVPGVDGARVSYSLWSSSGMLDWTILDSLSAVVAARQDFLKLNRTGQEIPPFRNADYRRTLSPFSYNASLVWRLSPEDTLRATIGRGNQTLSHIETGLATNTINDVSGESIVVSGNPRLNPAEMTQTELGWTRYIQSINGSFVVNIYYQNLKNITSFFSGAVLSVNNTPTITYGNLGDQKLWGFESSLDGRMGPFRASASYSWANGEIDVKLRLPVSDVIITGERISLADLARRHLVKSSIGWARGDWSVDLLAIWQSAQGDGLIDEDDPSRVGASLGTQGAISWTPEPNVRVTVAASNFLQSSTRLSIAPPLDRRLWLSVHVDF